MSSGEFRVEPGTVRSVAQSMASINSSAQSSTSSLGSMVLQALSFAQIGSSVGAANTTMHSSLVEGFSKFVQLISDIESKVTQSANAYDASDQAVAQGYGGGTGGGSATPGTTDGTTGGGAATGGQQPAAQPAQNGQIDSRVIDSIMRSEGTQGEQGGRAEVYGFRQGNAGYNEIMAARNQYGVGSAEERAVVTRLMTRRAEQAGALNFTDAGVQAAITSGAHMRGTGGVQAIMNHMAGDAIQRSGTLSQNAIQHIQGLTPEQFQQDFRDARLEYDRQVYGNTTTHQGGHTDNWWHRYGNGLTDRYDREQQEFLNIGRQPAGQ